MLSKTIQSAIPFSEQKEDTNKALNNTIRDVDNLIQEIGTSGGWYVGDGIDMDIYLTYNDLPRHTFQYQIPMNDPDSVAEINARLTEYAKDLTKEEREEHGFKLYYSTEEHLENFRRKLFNAIKSIYEANDKPTSGRLTIDATATYDPENK